MQQTRASAPAERGSATSPALDLLDWRRRVAALYTAVREEGAPEAAWRLWRDGRDRLFREHPQSPLGAAERRDFAGLPLHDYDPALRLPVSLEPLGERAPLEVPAGADGTVRLRPLARTLGLRAVLGGELELYWIAGYGGGLFLPFADASNRETSYGGGRYLLDTIKGADLGETADGRLLLDFNFAYNPSCAYSPAWTCPLAPPGNRLPARIEAGEMAPA